MILFVSVMLLLSSVDLVDIDTFNKLISDIDVAIGLRYPTVGESSGTIIKFLHAGKPCIVSNVEQFGDLSDSCTIKVSVDKNEIKDISNSIIKLATDDELRNTMSQRAREFAEFNHNPQ